MNQQDTDAWQELGRIWKTGNTPVTVADIEALHARQHHRVRIARAAEFACSALGVVAALWLAFVSPLRWVGILTVVFSIATVFFTLRLRRMPVPHGAADLVKSLDVFLTRLDRLAEQLRYGRALGFMAVFAVVMAASNQLMRPTVPPRSVLFATAGAGVAISAVLAWNMIVAWQVWRRSAQLVAFRKKLMTERDGDASG
jgi:hypothetical protein